MTHNHTQAAVELAGKIRCDDCFVVGGCDDNSTRLIKAALRTAHNAGLEEAAKEVIRIWKEAPNTRKDMFMANRISHGCVASEKAIRALSDSLRDGEG